METAQRKFESVIFAAMLCVLLVGSHVYASDDEVRTWKQMEESIAQETEKPPVADWRAIEKEQQGHYTCFLNVKLGERVFRIPSYHSTYSTNSHDAQSARGKCHARDASPINITKLSIAPLYLPGYTYEDIKQTQEETKEGYAVQILVDFYPKDYFAWLEFEGAEKKLKEEGKRLQDLPVQGDYYVYNTITFIAKNKKFITSKGKPVVFECGQSCTVSVPLNNNMRLSIHHISTTFIPQEKWYDFYRTVMKYISEMNI